jgi:hypothetical protein
MKGRILLGWLQVLLNTHVDNSELKKVIEETRGRVVFAVYGHTSFADSITSLIQCPRLGIKVVVAHKHRNKIPLRAHKYVEFVGHTETTTSNASSLHKRTIEPNTPLGICIEGTRGFKDYVHSGFYHLAKKNKMKIVFLIQDYAKFTFRCSTILDPAEHTVESCLDVLRDFVRERSMISMYPKQQNTIRLR